jgi:hypothetical protein
VQVHPVDLRTNVSRKPHPPAAGWSLGHRLDLPASLSETDQAQHDEHRADDQRRPYPGARRVVCRLRPARRGARACADVADKRAQKNAGACSGTIKSPATAAISKPTPTASIIAVSPEPRRCPIGVPTALSLIPVHRPAQRVAPSRDFGSVAVSCSTQPGSGGHIPRALRSCPWSSSPAS